MTTTATMKLCKDCWHVTDSDYCPECGAGEHNRGANSPFLTDLTRDDIRAEMVRARDFVVDMARQIDWHALSAAERVEARGNLGAANGNGVDLPAGPWLAFDYNDRTVTVGMWVTEYLHDDDDYVADGPDAWAVDRVIIPIGGTS